ASHSRKRKRSVSPGPLTVKTHELETSHGPRLATFPAIDAPERTPFTAYGSTLHGELIAAETDRIEYEGKELTASAQYAAATYLVAVFDKSKNTLTVRRAPLHVLERRVKRLKTLALAAVSGDLTGFQQQRTELGTVFGTKKAQAAIRAAARNKVDVNAMSTVTDHLQARIESQTHALPTKDEAQQTTDEGRMVPPHRLDATRSEDAYPLSTLIPENEFSAISIVDLLHAGSHDERRMLLPIHVPPRGWLHSTLTRLFASPPSTHKEKDTVRILWYVAAMLAWRRAAGRREASRADIAQTLAHLPASIVDAMTARFMESAREGKLALTADGETRWHTWLLALMLHVDGFQTDVGQVASTVPNATVPKVNTWFRALGCKVGSLTGAERQKRGLSDDDQTKFATLKLPLEFPKAKSKPSARR
ncbi:RNA polymerase I associated factor, A49-like protein, partial [Auriculariales sp. MPI-PUGE-AT-0066]